MSQSVLIHSRYKPARGGHAPGDLRNAFLEAIEAFEAWEEGADEPTVDVRDRPVTITRLCGLLWNCSDTMPGSEQRVLEDMLPGRWIGDDRRGTLNTYAMAARAMRESVARAHAAPAI
ncbi:BRA0787 family protein [Methylorubrum aminovorans]